jgi:N-acylneuraminate cytidylyltransferase
VSSVEVLAVVPARGGSKSIPRKNIVSFAGHPLLAYSIAAGLQARRVSRLIVSTEDSEIADRAMQYGAEVPFLRPAELAQDDTPDLPVFRHALGWLAEHESYHPEIVVQLRPTSPVRPRDCVDRAVEMLVNSAKADSVRGVVPASQNPFKMWRIDEEGVLQPLLKHDLTEAYNRPRQALPQSYWQTGQVDAIRYRTISDMGSMTGHRILPLVLDASYAVDIDTPRDWARAERLVQTGELDMVRPGLVPRPLPEKVELLVLDFDGVLTDDRVWVSEQGLESVAANRKDGYGIARLKEHGVEVVVLTRESNPVVAARCAKLGIQAIQGVVDKGSEMRKLLDARRVDPARAVYLGNDLNDLPCFPLVGCAVAVADAHPAVRAAADLRLTQRGGHGAVRELCEMLLDRMQREEPDG